MLPGSSQQPPDHQSNANPTDPPSPAKPHFDPAPRYKYMFGSHRGLLPHFVKIHNETYIINHCDEIKQKAQWLSENKTQENHEKPDH